MADPRACRSTGPTPTPPSASGPGGCPSAGFLRLARRGQVVQRTAPTLWDVDFRTAVSQAELEDRERPGAYHRLRFPRVDAEGGVEIETTRPELLPACVALVAHPDDARYRPLFGTSVATPLFGVRVPVVAHELADPEKGSGIAMICTFGDTTDVVWWRELDLPTRTVVGRDGRLLPVDVRHRGLGVRRPGGGRCRLRGAGRQARSSRPRPASSSCSTASGDLIGEPRPITHPVKFFEKGDRPLEIVSSRQWFVETLPHREALLARGEELALAPAVHVPPLPGVGGGPDGRLEHQPPAVLRRAPARLVPGRRRRRDRLRRPDPRPTRTASPSTRRPTCPTGTRADQRGEPGGFVGDPDVMDTWATSSLTPQIAGGWEDDPDLFARVFPMDLRPQAHDIIRTWLFSTVVRSELEHGALPWTRRGHQRLGARPRPQEDVQVEGERGDPAAPARAARRRRRPVLGGERPARNRHRGRRGPDEGRPAAGHEGAQRLAVRPRPTDRRGRHAGGAAASTPSPPPSTGPCSAAWPWWSTEATTAFEGYDYARALERTEAFFWSFCDDYLELVKSRAYGDADDAGTASARAALAAALSVLLRLLAPILPFVTEEVWSWWRAGSIHAAAWPTVDDARPGLRGRRVDPTTDAVLEVAAEVLGLVRRAKTTAKRSMRAQVARLTVTDTPARLEALAAAEGDLRDAGGVVELVTVAGRRDRTSTSSWPTSRRSGATGRPGVAPGRSRGGRRAPRPGRR